MAGTERTYEHKHEEPAAEVEQQVTEPQFEPRGAVPVTGLANPTVRRAGAEPHDELGGTAVAPDVAATLSRRRGQGAPLPDSVTGSMGAAYGMDFSPVRVHNDREADTISRSLQASAFTYGTDIYFSGGTYAPTSQGGQKLIAHELAHVVQQSTGADSASSSGGPTVGRASDPAETQADAMADQAVSTLRRQAARVDLSPAEAPTRAAGGSTDAVRRQAKLVGTPAGGQVIRRGFFANLWDKLFGGKKPKKGKGATKETVNTGGTGGTGTGSSGSTGSTGGTGGTTSTETPTSSGGSGSSGTTDTAPKTETVAPKVEPVKTPSPDGDKDTVEYPTTIQLGTEMVRVESADDVEEAKEIVEELKSKYGLTLSSDQTIAGIKGQYTKVLVDELAKLKASVWEMKELRGLLAAAGHYAPILGTERSKSSLKDKAQGVTSIGKLKNAIDRNADTGKLDTTTLGEMFHGTKNLGLFDKVTNYKDRHIIREGAEGPDNATGIEATAIHEMAHALIQPIEIGNWVTTLAFWTDANTPSGTPDAEPPPTGYGKKNAREDLCESVAMFFLNRPNLEKVAPERAKFLDKMVKSWTPKQVDAVIDESAKAKGGSEPEDGKAA